MPRSDFSSSCGAEKLYGNASIDPPNGLGRCGEFVSVITSCWSASSRWAMYLPEKPNAPVTAIRTPASDPIERHLPARITHSACDRLIRLDAGELDHLAPLLAFPMRTSAFSSLVRRGISQVPTRSLCA